MKRNARGPRNNSLWRFDLGIRRLLPEWKTCFSSRWLREDLISGVTLACIAVPLSLAIALASGVSPSNGIMTAIIAGIVCACFGGTRLAVSGPAAAMAVLIATNIEEHGFGGLLVICLICGLLQILTGVFGLARFSKYVPSPVIAGFTAGIGAIIFIGQLPRILGVGAPPQADVVNVLSHLATYIHEANTSILAVGIVAIVIMIGLPKLLPRMPAPLFAVFIPTILVLVLSLDVPTIGTIPREFPPFQIPTLPTDGWFSLISSGLMVYFLASLETLLSSSAVDKLSGWTKHDPDQELIGQGLGNIIISFFGGIPVSGVIARSALNVHSGAKTRRASVFHSIALILCVVTLAPFLELIPLSALAGVLLSIAVSMVDLKDLQLLFRVSKQEAATYIITFLTIVFVDLIAGIEAGMVFAGVILLIRLSQSEFHLSGELSGAPLRVTLRGSLDFLSTGQIEELIAKVEIGEAKQDIILDASSVSLIDVSGAQSLLEFIKRAQKKSKRVIVKGLSSQAKLMIEICNKKSLLLNLVCTESDILDQVTATKSNTVNSKLHHGVALFRTKTRGCDKSRAMFNQLSLDQKPHTLFISCSDSRIDPNLITSCDPGELFIMRNLGNLIPQFEQGSDSSVGAVIEYAVEGLRVQNIIVCGHSGCGAISLASQNNLGNLADGPLRRWLEGVRLSNGVRPSADFASEFSKHNVEHQIRNLLAYPPVISALESASLSVSGWFYDLGRSNIQIYDNKVWKPISSQTNIAMLGTISAVETFGTCSTELKSV